MLKLNDISVSYKKDKKVLRDLRLNVMEGEVFGILGMNGAGKTTLFKTIYGFLKAEKGSISFNDKKVDFKNISYLETQNYFYSYMKGREYLNIITKGNIDYSLNKIFDLPLDELVDNYSTGMKKRLAFWGVMELNKELVILDEPFNGVDVESVECFYVLIERMRKNGATILISSHIIESLIRACNRIAYLSEGMIKKIYGKEDFTHLQDDIKILIEKKVSSALND